MSGLSKRLFLPLALTLALVAVGCGDNPLELDTSGELVIDDITVGDGEEAEVGSRVVVTAVGTLEDGTVFDDPEDVDGPYVFELGTGVVIEGWEQGIPGMMVGGTRRLTIPPRLAFGTRSSSEVPANSTVIYEIDLIEVGHPDSLAVTVLEEGEGEIAASGDSLTLRYTGTLANGRLFDRSNSLGFVLDVDNIISGFEMGVTGMQVGEVRRLIIPPALAYGNQGTQTVPPGATLVFEVELLDVTEV